MTTMTVTTREFKTAIRADGNKDLVRDFERYEAKDYSPVRVGFSGQDWLYQVFFRAFDGAWYPCSEHGENYPTSLAQATSLAADFSHADIY